METIRGTVQRLIFANESNSYCVFLLYDYNEERITCTGKCEAPKEGDELELTGRFVEHPKYGTQFDVRTLEKCKPDTIGGAKQYLMNLGVKGFGEKSAEKVIAYFEDEIIDILKSDDPKELLDVPGLRKSIKEDLYHTLIGEGALQELNRFLEAGGLSAKWSRDIYNIYGGAAIDVLRDNPYTLLHIPGGPSFTMADTLASSLGIEPDDPNRIEEIRTATFLLMYFVICPAFTGGELYTSLADPASRALYVSIFQTGWFVESMWSQALVIHMLRTPKLPFVQSRAAAPVTLLTLAGSCAVTVIPFTPLGTALGFTALPAAYFLWLAAIVAGYMLLATAVKKSYVRRYSELL